MLRNQKSYPTCSLFFQFSSPGMRNSEPLSTKQPRSTQQTIDQRLKDNQNQLHCPSMQTEYFGISLTSVYVADQTHTMQTIATDRQKQKGLFDSAAGVTSLLCRNLSVQRVSTCGVQCCVVPTTGEEQIVFRVRELCSDVSFSFITFVFIYIVPNYNTKFSAGLTVYYDLFFLS